MANCYNRFQLESVYFEHFFKQNCVMGFYLGWIASACQLAYSSCLPCLVLILLSGFLLCNSASSDHMFPQPHLFTFWPERLLFCQAAASSACSFVRFPSVRPVPTNTSSALTEYKMTEQTADLNLSLDEYILWCRKKNNSASSTGAVLLHINLVFFSFSFFFSWCGFLFLLL